MTGDAWITLAVIVALVIVFVTERVGTTVAIAAAVGFLYVLDVVDLDGAFSGFSNPAPITVAALYVLAGAADITGALARLATQLLGRPSAGPGALARVIFPVAGLSAVVPNTPLVAMFAPRVQAWARAGGLSPGRFLLPLSFATILGGVVTVIGTSTNLVVNGFMEDAGFDPFGVFEITLVGLPIAVIGGVLLWRLTPTLLRDRAAAVDNLGRAREFTVEMLVVGDGDIDGKTVIDAGLRSLQGVYLIQIQRDGSVLVPVSPNQELVAGDRLVFAGNVDRIVDLQNLAGLVMAEEKHFGEARLGQQFFEVVIGEAGPLNGSTLKEVGFRNSYGAAVVAVHRAAGRIEEKLGEARLRTGDVLLVVAQGDFKERMRDRSDFSVVAPLDQGAPVRRRGGVFVGLSSVALLVAVGSGVVDLTRAAVAMAIGLVAFRVITPSEARRSINISIILLIAFAFGLGTAVAQSGLAGVAADRLLDGLGTFGDVGILAGVAVGTVAATEVLSNNAAAALMFPIAVAVAAETGIAVEPLAIAIMMLASASFLTPIGYQTNTMVYGMGGYRFTDFARLGFPLTTIAVVVTLVVTPLVFPLR